MINLIGKWKGVLTRIFRNQVTVSRQNLEYKVNINIVGGLDVREYPSNINALLHDPVLQALFDLQAKIWWTELTRLDPIYGTEIEKIKYASCRSKVEGLVDLKNTMYEMFEEAQIKNKPKGEEDE